MERAFPPAWPHRDIEEVFPDVFLVTGLMKMQPQIRRKTRPSAKPNAKSRAKSQAKPKLRPPFQFSRNMVILRQDRELVLVNSVRLTEPGLEQLDALGKVAHVIKLGFFHDRDDAFYVHRYGARFWALPGHNHAPGLRPDVEMRADTELPIRDARLFVFETAQKPEAIIHLARRGGILIACDSLQNWVEPGPEFNLFSRWAMRFLGFLEPASVGRFWLAYTRTQQRDFERLHALTWRHVLGAHGQPLRDTAHEQFGATFRRILRHAAR